MIDFIIQFVVGTLSVTVPGLLFWKVIRRCIRQEVEIKCPEKNISKLAKQKNDLTVGDVVTWIHNWNISDNKECIGIYIGKNKNGTRLFLDEYGAICSYSPFAKESIKYNIKINFDPIPTEEEKLKKRVEYLESINETKNKNTERNQNETNKI